MKERPLFSEDIGLPGSLFVWEGPDGVGKTTTIQLVETRLIALGYPTLRLSFPGQAPESLGRLVYDIHHDRLPGLQKPSAYVMQLLHVAAHVDAIEQQILPALRRGMCVLLDRYWWSTWAYGRTAGIDEDRLKAMLRPELDAWSDLLPQTLFLLKRANEASPQLSKEYAALAEREPRFPVVTIDNSHRTAAETAEDLSALVIKRLRTRPTQPGPTLASHSTPPLSRPPLLFSKLDPVKPSAVFDTYWRFACERQAIFFRRLRGELPLTRDPILQQHKFTNAYRASDRVSQFLIRNVAYEGSQLPQEVFFRILLFKLFNKIDTWKLLVAHVGFPTFEDFDLERYASVLDRAIESGKRIYSAAYIMPMAPGFREESRKHRTHLRWLQERLRERLAERLAECRTMRQAFDLLRATPMLGDFLAYQFVTDVNYSTLTDFTESEFVVPGPGARDGLKKCFLESGGLGDADLIRLVMDRQEMEFARLGLSFQDLWGRCLQLIDCQNVFCEVDKYARVAHPEVNGVTGRTRIKQLFQASSEPIRYWYPPKWGLNDKIETELRITSEV